MNEKHLKAIRFSLECRVKRFPFAIRQETALREMMGVERAVGMEDGGRVQRMDDKFLTISVSLQNFVTANFLLWWRYLRDGLYKKSIP